MQIIVSVPVKGYLKKYLIWRLNIPEQQAWIGNEVIDLNQRGELTMVLRGLLEGTLSADPENISHLADYDSHVMVQLTRTKYNRNLLVYTADGIRWFNSYLYHSFHDFLLQRILINMEHGIPEKESIYATMEELNLYDLITFEALKKASYRLRKVRKIPNFSCGDRQQAQGA